MYPKRRLFFVRHGETEWNSAFRYQGKTDVPLGDNGRRQAVLLGKRLKSVPFDMVYTSPLSRALETASIVARQSQFHLETVAISKLSEMSFGSWESLTVAEVRDQDPEFFLSWREDPSSFPAPGGESFGSLVSRVGSAIRDMLSGHGEKILIICHGGTIRAAMVSLIGISAKSAWKLRVDNCSITAFDITQDRTTLRYSNDAVHLKAGVDFVGKIPLL